MNTLAQIKNKFLIKCEISWVSKHVLSSQVQPGPEMKQFTENNCDFVGLLFWKEKNDTVLHNNTM